MQLQRVVLAVLFAVCLCTVQTSAQSSAEMGKLRIHVDPKQGYVFVDGKAIREGNQTVELSVGDHRVAVYNYGYLPNVQTVHIGAGETTDVRVTLESSGDKVAGPFGDIELKGDPRAAVLLTGATPDFFVGHVDEFDWMWIWHQRLLVKPGTYQVTATREGKTIWSGPVTIEAGQKVVVYLDKDGKTKVKAWKKGLKITDESRFQAGIANSTVAIAPVSATLAASDTQLNCGQSTNLTWSSTNAVDSSISPVGDVPRQGTNAVTPLQPTTYILTAKGAGGTATQRVAVDVNTQPEVTITLSQSEVQYHKIGDRIVQQDSATLQWSTSNADSAKMEGLLEGNNAIVGSQTVTAEPKQTSRGPISEDVTYTVTAQNACGGTATRTATLHIFGSIDPPPSVTLASLFYPTAYPTKRHPEVGLLASEKQTLTNVADQFRNYEQYEGKASLTIVGHADVRGPEKYNQELSERRAALVRDFLISKGIPGDKIETRAEGKSDQIDLKTVQALESNDQQKPAEWMTRHPKSTWLAYNRRIDIVLQPTGQDSIKTYPNASFYARILWQRPVPTLKQIERASSPENVQQTSANTTSGE